MEQRLQPRSGEEVAKQASSAQRNGWSPRWTQAADLEFCIEMKTGAALPFEVHGLETICSTLLDDVGFIMRADAAGISALLAGAAQSAKTSQPPGWHGLHAALAIGEAPA